MSLERCESGYGKALDGEEFGNNALLKKFQREAVKNLVNVNSFSHTEGHVVVYRCRI